MKEQNRESLRKAIEGLPMVSPEDNLWDGIQDALDQASNAEKMKHALKELPSYDPPQEVWDTIQEKLSTPEKGKRIRLFTNVQRIAAAAVIGLVALSIWLYPAENKATEQLVFAVEEVPQFQFVADWNEEEEEFNQVMRLTQYQAGLSGEASYQELTKELEELNQAKKAIQDAMQEFGTEADMIKKLSKVERERSDILKKIAKFI